MCLPCRNLNFNSNLYMQCRYCRPTTVYRLYDTDKNGGESILTRGEKKGEKQNRKKKGMKKYNRNVY